jgi:hypothetical protein
MRAATDDRNSILHDLWATNLDGTPFHAKGGVPAPIPSVTELRAVSGNLFSLALELNRERQKGFLKEAMDANPALPAEPSAPTPIDPPCLAESL